MSSWVRVTNASPCRTCGKTDWCSTSRDGSYAICRRRDDGTGRAKVDRGGGEYWVYRRDEAPVSNVTWIRPAAAAAAVPPSRHLHDVYASILEVLPLAAEDRRALRERGLTDEDIEVAQYRTLAAHDRRRALAKALKLFGEAACLAVPGVILRRENRDSYLCLAGAPGLLVPVRNAAGEIVALKLRRRAKGSSRYLYLSSVATGGPGPGSPVHVPMFAGGPSQTVRVTEGELKADVATSLSQMLTISIAGVGTWRKALETLRALGAHTVRLAFDADVHVNRHVATALDNLARELDREHFDVELETWAPQFKGIDDCLAAGERPTVLSGTAALDECRRILGGFAIDRASA